MPWSCIDAAPGCRALRRSSNNILTAWPGRVVQAPRAGRTRAPCGPAHHIGARVENRPVEGPARARRRSELGNRRSLRHGQLSSPWRSGRRFANFQRQRGPAGSSNSVSRANTPRSLAMQPAVLTVALGIESSRRCTVVSVDPSILSSDTLWTGHASVRRGMQTQSTRRGMSIPYGSILLCTSTPPVRSLQLCGSPASV